MPNFIILIWKTMGKIINQTFFNGADAPAQPRKNDKTERSERKAPRETELRTNVPVRNSMEIRKGLAQLVQNTVAALEATGMNSLAQRVQHVFGQVARETFTVAFVGEFNRGKSTLINKLLGASILPVAALPTTALLTRVRYGMKPRMMVFDAHGMKQKELPLEPESWKGLTAANFDEKEEPEGFVTVLMDKPWLGKYGIELMDTPGAGDLSKKRTKVIGEALQGCEAAVIAVNAAQPLSLSEKLFIEQRLIANRTPFLALAINRLDLVPLKDRDKQIAYIISKLESWKINVPVIIPDNIELPSERYAGMRGLDKLRGLMVSWLQRPERARLMEQWLAAQVAAILTTARNTLAQQMELYRKSDAERMDIIGKKTDGLQEMALEWSKLRVELTKRCGKCYELFQVKYGKLVDGIVEKLQFEAGHAGMAQKWWTEDYPYRLKIEAANLASQLDNFVAGIVAMDAKWLNDQLNGTFKTYIQIGREPVTDKQSSFLPVSVRTAAFEDLDKKKNMLTLGSAALSIAGWSCGLGIIAMGIGAGTGILSSKFLKEKREEQQKQLKDMVAKDVPAALADAVSESEKKIQIIYADIAAESVKKEKDWMAAQKELIQKANAPKNEEYAGRLQEEMQRLTALYEQFETILE